MTLATLTLSLLPTLSCPSDVTTAMASLSAAELAPIRIEAHYQTREGEEAVLQQQGTRVSWHVGDAKAQPLPKAPGPRLWDSEDLVRWLGKRLHPEPASLRPLRETADYAWTNDLGSGTAVRRNGEWAALHHQGVDGIFRICTETGCVCE